MELLKSVKCTPLSDVLRMSTTGFQIPQVQKYPFHLLTKISTDPLAGVSSISHGNLHREDKYIPLNSEDSLQWIKFVQEIIINGTLQHPNVSIDNSGIVVILDCAYQWGSKDMPNSLMFSFKHHLSTRSTIDDEKKHKILDRVVVVDGIDSMSKLTEMVMNIDRYIPEHLHHLPLKCVVISNLSVFYWGMRESSNFEPSNELHRTCRQAINKFGCYFVTSRSAYNE